MRASILDDLREQGHLIPDASGFTNAFFDGGGDVELSAHSATVMKIRCWTGTLSVRRRERKSRQ